MRSENAMVPSRREFLSDAVGIGLVTASTWSILDGEALRLFRCRCRSRIGAASPASKFT